MRHLQSHLSFRRNQLSPSPAVSGAEVHPSLLHYKFLLGAAILTLHLKNIQTLLEIKQW
jgi:hypothetical protein